MSRQYLIQDPHHEYAVRFMDHMYRRYGYRAVCYYTDRSQRLRLAAGFPALASEQVAASYDVPLSRLAAFADYVRGRHDIACIVPFNEPAVLPAAQLAGYLGLVTPRGEVMALFRDKFLMKDHLRRTSGLRINDSRRVADLAEILAVRAARPRRLVIKPNDGYGNREIALIDADTPVPQIRSYLQRLQGRALVLEDYVGGQEYFVNGQVDAVGKVTVVAVFAYRRAPANGHPDIDHETRKVAHADPLFATLADYAAGIVAATGLTRSPFHLELKVDEQGACLIEVAARLPGLGNALLCEQLHGGLDLFALAAHYYLSDAEYGPMALDWTAYDAQSVRYVHGVSTRAGRVQALSAAREVERLPQFSQWVHRPVLGERVAVTRDCLTMPWNLILQGASEAELDAAVLNVRGLLQAAPEVSRAARIAVGARALALRVSVGLGARVRAALCADEGFENGISPRAYHLVARSLRAGARWLDKLVLRGQLRGIGAGQVAGPPPPSSPEQAEAHAAALAWGDTYLGRSQPGLGRKGAVCPFIKQTMALGQMFVSVHEGVDGRSVRRLRRIVLDEAKRYALLCPLDDRKAAFSGLVVVLPDCPPDRYPALDHVHAQLKTCLMREDLMFSAFHPHSVKPSIANPNFHPFAAPFAAFVIRRVDVRDIAFLGHNRGAFQRYYERFAPVFRERAVSNEYSHVRLFEQACERFGFTYSTDPAPAG